MSATVGSTCLTSLPSLPLEQIASYLSFADLLELAASSPALSHLQPRLQQVTGEDFSKTGPRGGDFCPETYMDVAVLTRGLKSVAMSFLWADQGYGNRKGQVWLQLVREGEVIADCRKQFPALAPHCDRSAGGHELDRREVEVVGHPVVSLAVRGDTLRVARNIGGGGGHRLNVRQFNMTIVHKKELDEEGWAD